MCVVSAVSEAESVLKVAEWQQTYYATDSGIQSGATTMQDDESTEYSNDKKYKSRTTTTIATVTVMAKAGEGDTAFSGLETQAGKTFIIIWLQMFCYVLPVCFPQ